MAKFVAINSKFRLPSETESEFVVNMRRPLPREVKCCKLVSANIPANMLVVNSSNNMLVFREQFTGVFVVTVPVGNYSPLTLATAVQTAMNSAGGSTYTVTYSSATNKFTISATPNNFRFGVDLYTPVRTGTVGPGLLINMGWALPEASYSLAASQTGENQVYLNNPLGLFISMDNLDSANQTSNNPSQPSWNFYIPYGVPSYSLNNYLEGNGFEQKCAVVSTSNSFRVRVFDIDGRSIFLESDWEVVVAFY